MKPSGEGVLMGLNSFNLGKGVITTCVEESSSTSSIVLGVVAEQETGCGGCVGVGEATV
jgi:hypothetical protein